MDKRRVVEEITAFLNDELAEAGPERAAEIRRLLQMYRFLPVREFGPDDVVCPSALVGLELQGGPTTHFLIVPSGGGLVTRIEGLPVQVITPQSPMGEALMGKKAGDQVVVEARTEKRCYRVLSVR